MASTIDISGYVAAKAKGAAKVFLLNGQLTYSMRRFDPDSGAATPQTAPIALADVQALRDQVVAQLAGIDQLLSDISAAKEVLP